MATPTTPLPRTGPPATGSSSSQQPRSAQTEQGSGDASNWHTLSVEQVIDRLGTGLTGLASAEAAQRLHVYGPNELQALTRVSAWHTFAAQFQNVLILILLGATFVSGSSVTRSRPLSSRSSCCSPCCSVSSRNTVRGERSRP